MSVFDVIFFDVKKREGRSRPYRVRWAVAGRRFEKSFRTRALADHFRVGLLKAARAGEAFDKTTGRPESEAAGKIAYTTWYEHARAYAEMKWPNAAAKSRRAMSDALATITIALVDHENGMPPTELLRAALYGWAFNPSKWEASAPSEVVEALRWMDERSLPIAALASPDIVRRALNACARTLSGKPAAATTTRRKRAVFANALGFALERGAAGREPDGQGAVEGC